MNEFNNNNSRVDKFEKRRKNTKSISLFLILGGILIIVLLAMFLFGGNDEEAGQPSTVSTSDSESSEGSDESTKDEKTDDTTPDEDDESTTDDSAVSKDTSGNESEEQKNTSDESSDNKDVEKESVDVSDSNVKEAYTGNWEPIGTEQKGPHTTQFDTKTQDWKEMKKAIRVATGIQEGNMITWMIENGGDQKAVGTVSPDNAPDKTYQVNLTWIENEGWKPTMVKIIKENPYK